jgi:hypothetical protein
MSEAMRADTTHMDTINPTPESIESQPVAATAVQEAAFVADRRGTGRRASDNRGGGPDRRSGLDRRRGPGRRRSDDRRSAEEGEMTEDQFEFVMAINEYKNVNRRPFPTWTEILDIIKALGYRKVAKPQDIQ